MDYKYKTVFSSQIKPLVSEDCDKYLAKASFTELKKFLPEMDLDRNHDLLPIMFAAFNINQFNRNGDGLDSQTAINLYKTFVYKFLDINHKRSNIIGVILSSALSEYITDKEVTEKEIIAATTPFNCIMTALIWRVANPDLAEAVENSNNPTSEFYNKIFASLEVGFKDFDLVTINGSSKNLEDGKIISDPEEIKQLEPLLLSNGGTGKLKDGTRLYRLVKGEVLGLGMALVEHPAANVRPIIVLDPANNDKNDQNVAFSENKAINNIISENNTNNISHIKNDNVNNTRLNNFNMDKITIKDIPDELLKEIKASAQSDFIEDSLVKKSEEWAKEKREKDAAVKVATDRSEVLAKDLEKANEDLKTIKAEVEKLNLARAEQEKVSKYNQRMSLLDDTYDLVKEDREVIAKRLKDLEDEDFSSYEKELAVFLKDKNKVAKAEALKITETDKKKQEATASAQKTVDDALDNAEKDKAKIPNGNSAEKSKKEKYAAAFSLEGFSITNK